MPQEPLDDTDWHSLLLILHGTLVSEWLGHSNMKTTLIYARTTDEMKRQAQRKLGKKEGSVFKDDIAFKYADNEAVLKKLAGHK